MDVRFGENGESMYLFEFWHIRLICNSVYPHKKKKKKLLISVTKQKEKREQYISTVVDSGAEPRGVERGQMPPLTFPQTLLI